MYNLALLETALTDMDYGFEYHKQTGSTMNLIQKKVEAGTGGRFVILTDHQTKGTGRDMRIWVDMAGRSLMFSALFHIPQESTAIFADMIALAICQSIRAKTGLIVKIKYPNDLVIDDKKFGGILVKNIYDDKLKYLGTNLGIGLNIHYSQGEIDKISADYKITSLDLISAKYWHRQDLLIEILKSLRYLEAETEVISGNALAKEPFDKKWKEFSSLGGREIVIQKGDKIAAKGRVVDTRIGEGVEIETKNGRKWFSLFESDMKVRSI